MTCSRPAAGNSIKWPRGPTCCGPAAWSNKRAIELDRLEVRPRWRATCCGSTCGLASTSGTPPGQPLVVLGDLDRLHVDVDIDEQDIPRSPRRGGQGVSQHAGEPLALELVRRALRAAQAVA